MCIIIRYIRKAFLNWCIHVKKNKIYIYILYLFKSDLENIFFILSLIVYTVNLFPISGTWSWMLILVPSCFHVFAFICFYYTSPVTVSATITELIWNRCWIWKHCGVVSWISALSSSWAGRGRGRPVGLHWDETERGKVRCQVPAERHKDPATDPDSPSQ